MSLLQTIMLAVCTAAIGFGAAMIVSRVWIAELLGRFRYFQYGALQQGRALHALAARYPHGHVDIPKEEWDAQEESLMELRLVEMDDRVRVLAK